MLHRQKIVVINSYSQYYFPLFANLSKLDVLIIGGGKVGTKRAIKFAEYGAKVTVVSLDFTEELLKNNDINKIKMDANEINADFISKYNIVITTTNNKKINYEICEKAKKLGKLCNNPTNPDQSSFIVPIFYANDNMEIAITTYGKSSIASKFILDKILEYFEKDQEYINLLIKTMGDVKKIMKNKVQDPSLRFNLYHIIFYDSIFQNYIQNNNYENAIKRAEEIINEHNR
ncbi:bifunctional precorrin-2 dehydrogenase/sirohydrochlorin ferrochelatase [Acidianus sulfidivorans JP7]|uniref:precorrin-2 dehydrogenase n=1 Tax=Acidianus sulfidivorans JP7 TaxID=619593 RepID=A0A2U9IMW2_9CREN|nr:bifunctional precorrin-2 dehydrogenase/sirohydrochlorin ferrochelatase [Acidianus sulfidivorans]AWR97347.1 bifunctional precorrin-2 dehydrogenase/sirohydrochlorin ferrochelatase [Acidianus sulfidivorans JP7]